MHEDIHPDGEALESLPAYALGCLDAKDADSLYRSLPPSVSLLVLVSP